MLYHHLAVLVGLNSRAVCVQTTRPPHSRCVTILHKTCSHSTPHATFAARWSRTTRMLLAFGKTFPHILRPCTDAQLLTHAGPGPLGVSGESAHCVYTGSAHRCRRFYNTNLLESFDLPPILSRRMHHYANEVNRRVICTLSEV